MTPLCSLRLFLCSARSAGRHRRGSGPHRWSPWRSPSLAYAPLVLFHQDLLRLRRGDPLIARQDHTQLDGAIIKRSTLVVRYCGDGGEDRLLVVNLGPEFNYVPAPAPLMAPSTDRLWQLVWSSDNPLWWSASNSRGLCGERSVFDLQIGVPAMEGGG
jgi:hypothetical protein